MCGHNGTACKEAWTSLNKEKYSTFSGNEQYGFYEMAALPSAMLCIRNTGGEIFATAGVPWWL